MTTQRQNRSGIRLAIFTAGLAAAAALPGAALAQASAKKNESLKIVGFTDAAAQSIEVPPQVQKSVDAVYSEYRTRWEVPRIDTLLDGKPVAFYMRRTPDVIKADPETGASATNFAPFQLKYPTSLPPHRDACEYWVSLSKDNWCRGDSFSIRFNEDRASGWYFPMLVSHEFMHLRMRELHPPKTINNALPYWVSEGLANGFGFGFVEHFSGLSREGIARKTAMLPARDNKIAAFLGLRYYDHPLPLIGEFAYTYPSNHPAYPGNSDVRWQMASYSSGSFFRHILKGRKHGFNAIENIVYRDMPTTNAWRPWVRWLDEGLKTATARDSAGAPLRGADGKALKVWPRGIRQVYAEMIADMADFPDRVAKHRVGRLAATKYDSYLWSKGCETVDLTTTSSWTKTLEIAPMAARCLRVKLPPEGLNMTGTDAALNPLALPPRFAITATSNDGGCNDLEAGTRGEVLPELMRFKGTKQPGKCIAKWLGFYLPLKINDPEGLKGFQTLVLSNVADDATMSQPRQIELTIVNPQVNGAVAAAQTVERGERKIKKPVPRPKPKAGPGGTGAIPQMGSPQMIEPEPPIDCDRDQRAIFECGDIMTVAFAYGDGADLAVEMEAMRSYASIDMLPAAFSPDGEDSIAKVIAASKGSSAMAGMMPQGAMKLAAGQGDGGSVSIRMQRLAPGQTGTFPAQVKLDWTAPGGFDGGLASLAPARFAPAGECVVATAMRATGQVTITRNSEGLLMGSVTAEFFEPNPDDRAGCRTPYVAAGTAQFDFSLGGIVTVGDLGDYEIDMDQMQKASEARLANAMALGGPMGAGMPGADYGGEEEAEAGPEPAPSPMLARMPGDDLVGDFDVPQCPERTPAELRRGLDQYLRQLREITPGITPDQLRTLREAMLSDPAGTAMILCGAGF